MGVVLGRLALTNLLALSSPCRCCGPRRCRSAISGRASRGWGTGRAGLEDRQGRAAARLPPAQACIAGAARHVPCCGPAQRVCSALLVLGYPGGFAACQSIGLLPGFPLALQAVPGDLLPASLWLCRLYQVTWMSGRGWSYAVDNFEDAKVGGVGGIAFQGIYLMGGAGATRWTTLRMPRWACRQGGAGCWEVCWQCPGAWRLCVDARDLLARCNSPAGFYLILNASGLPPSPNTPFRRSPRPSRTAGASPATART